MDKRRTNRQIVLRFFEALSGKPKTKSLLAQYTDDIQLIEHILFFEHLLPEYQLIPDEITTESDRVIVHARVRGKHTGTVDNIPPTHRLVEIPFAEGYHIEGGRITVHWFITDQFEILEQLNLIDRYTGIHAGIY
jgi:predicted ester cyclase